MLSAFGSVLEVSPLGYNYLMYSFMHLKRLYLTDAADEKISGSKEILMCIPLIFPQVHNTVTQILIRVQLPNI